MPVPILAILSVAGAFAPEIRRGIDLGITIGKVLADGRDELTDEEFALHIVEGDQIDKDLQRFRIPRQP